MRALVSYWVGAFKASPVKAGLTIAGGVVVLVLAAVALTGCSPDSGTVTGKRYVPESRQLRTENVYTTSCDSKGICTQKYSYTRTWWETVPECFRVEYRSQENKKGSDCTYESRYKTIKVGDHYSREES